MQKLSLGIDISKSGMHVCMSAIDSAQKVSVKRSGTFENNPSGFRLLQAWISKEHPNPAIPLVITMEATGVYYEQCALFLHLQGYRICVVLPNKAKKYVAALGLKTKNDKADAKALSRMGAEQALEPWQPMGVFFYELRELTRHNESLKALHTSLNNQLEAAATGMYQSQFVLAELKQAISLLEAQIKASAAAIAAHLRSNEAVWQKTRHLISVPGVGELTAAVILAETGGFALFTSSAQLVSYAGYDVVENQSGGRVGKTKISKKGNGRIRRILHMAALTGVSRQVPVLCNLFERTYRRHGVKMKSYVAVQKKILTLLYALWKKQQDFDKDHQAQNHTSGAAEAVRSSGLQPKAEIPTPEPVASE